MIDPQRYTRLWRACQAADRGRDTVPAHVDVLHDLLLEQHPVIFSSDGQLLRYISQRALRPHRDKHARNCRPLTFTDEQTIPVPAPEPESSDMQEIAQLLREKLLGDDVPLHHKQRAMLQRVFDGGPATVVLHRNIHRTRRRLHKIIRP